MNVVGVGAFVENLMNMRKKFVERIDRIVSRFEVF